MLTCLFGLFAVACNQTIEFDYNIDFVVDGEVIATVGTDGDKIAMPKNPTKEDYTFDGWYWDEWEWDDEFTLNSILDQPLQEKNNYKVYAKWKSSVYYMVIFYNAYGAYEGITQQIKYGEPTALRLNTFINDRENYVFGGWRNGDDTYQDGEVVLNLCDVGEEIRLSAEWTYVAPPIDNGSYTIIFDANGGEGTMKNQTIGTMDSVALSANTFTRKYCDFWGWSPFQEGDDVAFVDEGIVWRIASKGETVALYVRWKTGENVYFLDEPNDLLAVGENLSGIYVLQNDLNCVQLSLQPFAMGNDPFNGIFDGNGFSIDGVSLVGHNNEPGRISLFGYIGEKGLVKDLSVKYANTVSNVQEATIFAVNNRGTIENCYAFGCTVEVTDKNGNYVVRNAGLVLENHGKIKNCYFQGNIMSTVPIGEHGGSAGLCLINGGTIENSFLLQTGIQVINDRNTYGMVDALVGLNTGRVLNCFYDTESIFDVSRYTYKEDNNILTRFFLTSSFGGGVSVTRFNVRSFYVETLGWSEDIWDFSKVNYNYAEYPILKH